MFVNVSFNIKENNSYKNCCFFFQSLGPKFRPTCCNTIEYRLVHGLILDSLLVKSCSGMQPPPHTHTQNLLNLIKLDLMNVIIPSSVN